MKIFIFVQIATLNDVTDTKECLRLMLLSVKVYLEGKRASSDQMMFIETASVACS